MLPKSEKITADPSMPESQAKAEIEYKRIVDMAKRVGIVQTQRKGANKPKREKATATITHEGITVRSRDQTVAEPLLNAATDTVICMLMSRRHNVAVIVAHTWDSEGQVGIGCDVIKLGKARTANSFVKAFRNAVEHNASRRQMAAAPVPSASTSEKPRRRSTLADNTSATGYGYLNVESYLMNMAIDGSDGEDDFCEMEDDMDVHYISVATRASNVSSSSSLGCSHPLGSYLSVSAMPTISEGARAVPVC